MKVDQNGIPTVVDAESTVEGKGIGARVTVPSVPQTTYGTLVADLLAQFDASATILVDTGSRSIYAATGAAGSGLLSAVSEASIPLSILTPDGGQSGKSLAFSASVDPEASAELKAAIEAAVGAQKPKRSVSSLIAAILGMTFGNEYAPVIVVDQTSGEVVVSECEGSMQAVLDAIPNSGDRVKITLSEPSTPAAPEKFVFEGAAVP